MLVCWIGHADLWAMADDQPEPERTHLLKLAHLQGKYGEKPGPIKTAVKQGSFAEIHLVSDYDQALLRPFARWLGQPAIIHPARIDAPTDYPSIFRAAESVLADVTRKKGREESELCILLSPGTPAMTAVLVLLGKSRYPATFYQTHKGKLLLTEIPYDLVDDFVPELLRHPDRHLQHLAALRPGEVAGFQGIIGESPAIRSAVGRAQRAALRDVNVLILGESGTGKEMFAQAIHQASRRKTQRFKAINCRAESIVVDRRNTMVARNLSSWAVTHASNFSGQRISSSSSPLAKCSSTDAKNDSETQHEWFESREDSGTEHGPLSYRDSWCRRKLGCLPER
jgi:hypothetical protein